jgi:hypothetical protein
MSFTYCECPHCQFSVVVAASDIGPGEAVGCSLCWEDSWHEVAMTTRPATDVDKPEGADARFAPMTHFICHDCGKQCLSTVPEAEAQTEFEELYHRPLDRTKHPSICHDCFLIRQAMRR